MFVTQLFSKTRESEPARNEMAQAPAVIFKVGSGSGFRSGSSHFKEDKCFGGNVDKMFKKIIFFEKLQLQLKNPGSGGSAFCSCSNILSKTCNFGG